MIHYLTMPVRSDPAVKSGAFQKLFGEVAYEMRLTALVAPKTRRPTRREIPGDLQQPHRRASADDAHRAVINVVPDATTTADELDELIQSGADHYDVADTYLGRA